MPSPSLVTFKSAYSKLLTVSRLFGKLGEELWPLNDSLSQYTTVCRDCPGPARRGPTYNVVENSQFPASESVVIHFHILAAQAELNLRKVGMLNSQLTEKLQWKIVDSSGTRSLHRKPFSCC